MNMVDFQEKMDPTHRMYLCRMLNVKNLSEDLLGRYARVKRLIDRIDGHLTPGDLAMIIISVETPVLTKGEQALAEAVEIDAPSLDESDDKVIEEAVEKTFGQVEQEFGQDIAEKIMAEENAAPVEVPAMTGKQAEAAIASGAAKPVEAAKPVDKFWSPGMPVRVLHNEELLQGKIVGVTPLAEGSKKPVQLTVEFVGGETETFDEDEVEAV